MKNVSIKKMAVGRSDIHHIDPRIIEEYPGYNGRFNYTGIEELAESIKNSGLRVPLKVFVEGEQIYVSAGHRRLRAIKLLIEKGEDIKSVKCELEPKHFNLDDRIFDLVLTNDGVPFTQLEEGHIYLRLVNGGYNQTEIAGKVGKSQAHISNCLMLATTSKRIQNLMIEDRIACSSVMKVLKAVKNEEEAYEILIAAINGNDAENTEGSNGEPVTKRQAGTAAVRAVRGPTPNSRAKELQGWVEENAILLGDNPKYHTVKAALQYIFGETTIEDLNNVVK